MMHFYDLVGFGITNSYL